MINNNTQALNHKRYYLSSYCQACRPPKATRDKCPVLSIQHHADRNKQFKLNSNGGEYEVDKSNRWPMLMYGGQPPFVIHSDDGALCHRGRAGAAAAVAIPTLTTTPKPSASRKPNDVSKFLWKLKMMLNRPIAMRQMTYAPSDPI